MFINVLTQVIILLILIILGAVLTKGGVLTDKGVKSVTDLVLILVTPCVIIKSFIREFEASVLKNLLISFLIAFCVHLGFIILSRLLLHSKEKASERVLQFGVIFSNCGYMSIPLQQALLGDTGVFYGSSFISIFQLFIWSYGIILMSGDKKYLTPKKLIINPGIIGLAVGLVIFLLSIPVPKIISEPISYLASLNTPLPMIIIGYHLVQSNLFKGLKDIKCIFAIALKLVVFPLISLGVMYLCGIRGIMLVSSVISCSAPTAAITTMFSSKFSADTELSVNMVSLSTVLSLVTMPAIITLTQYIA
ncbi:MAG: AEC family transporter [Clostridia bacterium]|nr:AEC family transporter [Clostridia bacterium]